jgi:hypothetical protein
VPAGALVRTEMRRARNLCWQGHQPRAGVTLQPSPGALLHNGARVAGEDPPGAVLIAQEMIPTALGTFCVGLVGLRWPGSVHLPLVKAADGVRSHGC